MSRLYHPLEAMMFRNDPGVRNDVLGATYGPGVRRKADGTKKAHQGWDLYAREGTPAHAAADGAVAWTDNSGDYGLQLLLRFNRDGSMTSGAGTLFAFYAHLKDASPKKGEALKAGDLVKGGSKIGSTGVSGNADKKYPHLHCEIRDTVARKGGLRGRLDPSTVLGGALLSCGSEEIGGIDTVRMACIEKGASTPLFGR